jgi:sugar lactone lactonase YvrE
MALPAAAQTIRTIAGGGQPNDVPATSVGVQAASVAVDATGNVFTGTLTAYIFKVDPAGTLTTIAGAGVGGHSGDGGPAAAALVSRGPGVAVDSAGNLYVADTSNSRIRKVSPSGVITTIAGTGSAGFSGDGGPATSAQLAGPRGVAVDSLGTIYIADTGNDRIRKVTPAGVITTLSSVFSPQAVATDGSDQVYAADSGRVLRILPDGVQVTVAGSFNSGFSGDGGPATAATLSSPAGIAIDAAGNLYIADTNNHRIRRVNTAGIITTVAGTGVNGFSGDGASATSAALAFPRSVAVTAAGTVFIGDTSNRRIRRVSSGIITTIAGDGSEAYSGDGGLATDATLGFPVGVARDAAGNVYIADQHNHRVRKVSISDFTITTVAGTGAPGFSGDGGPGTSAAVTSPSALEFDAAGNLYIAEPARVRRLAPNGVITTVAGNGSPTFGGDGGPATAAGTSVFGLAVDAAGTLYIADAQNVRIRRVSGGIMTTIAGNGTQGYSGDGGLAINAVLGSPQDVATDGLSSVFIADRDNSRIRRIDVNGVITTVAGTGIEGFNGDGSALSAQLNRPVNVSVDSAGNVYINDRNNARIRRVTPTGAMTTVVGNGTAGFSGDGGPPLDARFNGFGIFADASGNLLIADSTNNRIREIIFEQSPVADAGSDQVVEWTGADTAVVLDGSGSSDGDGDALTFEWRDASGTVIAATALLSIPLPLGTYTFTLTVNDGNTTSTDTVTIRVQDTTAPFVTLTSTAPNPTNSTAIVVSAVFSESVTGFGIDDVVVTNAQVTAFSGSGSTYSFTLVPLAQGAVTANLVSGAAADASGNASPAAPFSRLFDSIAPTVVVHVSPNSLFFVSPATIPVTATDSSGVTVVTVNGQNGTWPGFGPWQVSVPINPAGAVQFSVTAVDAAGNVRTQVVNVDNDGIDPAIDRHRSTFADQSHLFSNDFVNGTTLGVAGQLYGAAVRATPAIGSDVLLSATFGPAYPYSSVTARALCGGNDKSIGFQSGEAARIWCQGTTLYVTGQAGIVEVTRYDGRSCSSFGGCTYFYTTISVPSGWTTSLGSPVTADPANPDALHVRLVRVLGGLAPPEPESAEFQNAVEYGSFTIDAGESVDVEVAPGNGVTGDAVTLSVLAGTVEVTVNGTTQTAAAGQEVTADASPRSDQVITFVNPGDKLFGAAPFAVSATSTSGLQVTFSAAGACSVSGATVSLNSAGACSITASQPGDAQYRPAPSVTHTFNVLHSWSNILQPVNLDGSSVFKLGSTVPVKFQLTGGSAAVTTLAARIYVANISNGIAGTEAEAGSPGNADAGNVFRFDASAGQYVFNWGTKGLSEGTWQIRVDLLDGSVRTVVVSLKK